jgi:hypothetical protein
MDTRLSIAIALLPFGACAATPPKPATPPGLSYILPAPAKPAPPNVLVIPRPTVPELRERLKALRPGVVLAIPPIPPMAPMRLLVFRDDDRAATRVFHPLLTPDVPVTISPAKPR